ncbi:hypothetical protein T492DRAFT_1150682 [Pavlovales sp. CCMP2436]|nr:hypothetical protein T492DRAFT_1150682 [Pavlovales sp. CCMP2436]
MHLYMKEIQFYTFTKLFKSQSCKVEVNFNDGGTDDPDPGRRDTAGSGEADRDVVELVVMAEVEAHAQRDFPRDWRVHDVAPRPLVLRRRRGPVAIAQLRRRRHADPVHVARRLGRAGVNGPQRQQQRQLRRLRLQMMIYNELLSQSVCAAFAF